MGVVDSDMWVRMTCFEKVEKRGRLDHGLVYAGGLACMARTVQKRDNVSKRWFP